MRSFLKPWKGNNLWISWIFVGALSLLCGLLAIIQSRWIEQIGNAQRQHLQTNLQNGLNRLSVALDQQIASSCVALIPSFNELESEGTEAACIRTYEVWKQTHAQIFQKIGVLKNDSEVSVLDFDTGRFAPSNWLWQAHTSSRQAPVLEFSLYGSMRRDRDDRRGPPPEMDFGSGSGPEAEPEPGRGERSPPREDLLLLELNADYLSKNILPELIARYIEDADSSKYDAKIVSASNGSVTIATTGNASFTEADGAISVLDLSRIQAAQQRPDGHGPGPPGFAATAAQPRWRLLVHRRDTSVDDVVSALRWRNFAVSGGILFLIVAMVAALVHYSRRANQLAQMQMSFVAGVSHDLRTPLTVIRTAAYNLRGRIATRPEQVEKYGQLIQKESEKLSLLVEQVLRYNAAKAGRLLGERHPVAVGPLIESSLESSLAVPAGQAVAIEKSISSDLPMIAADELALKHALQNLFDNAVKYGMEGSNWIGVTAKAVSEGEKPFVEIQISDRGPGIPAKEQSGIFDAFVRGERALQDHINGTGLGLNLVKRIVKAHGGAIRLVSGPAKGASFIMRLPAAPEELQNECANTVG